MKILNEGDAAVTAYQNSARGKKNAENEKFRVPIGTFLLGKFTEIEEEMDGKIQTYFVYPLYRDGVKVSQVSIPQLEKTAMWNFETSAVKKKDVEKYFLVPNALRPLLEADKVRLEGRTVTITIAPEIGYKVKFAGSEGYPNEDAQKNAWLGRTSKRVYDMIIS